MIPEFALWKFEDLGARRADMPWFGYSCALAEPVQRTGLFGGIPLEWRPNLNQFLINFIVNANRYSTHSSHDLRSDGRTAWYIGRQSRTGEDRSVGRSNSIWSD